MEGYADGSSAAVVGASGFIGARLTAALRASGVDTATYTRTLPFTRDGRLDPRLSRAGIVYFVATTVNPALAETHPERAASDVAVLYHLLELVRRTGHGPTVVLTSSGGTVYDTCNPPPYREDAPTSHAAAYARVKLLLEHELLASADVLQPVVLRLANVYGPDQPTGQGLGVIAHWLQSAAAGRPLRVLGDPYSTTRDFVYVDDTVEALMRVRDRVCRVSAPPLPEIINIGSGVPTSLGDLLLTVREVVGGQLAVQREERRSFDRSEVWLDVSRAERHLGWTAAMPLADGIRASWDALVRRRERTG
jgi:UDP-glucose 4-epimerase